MKNVLYFMVGILSIGVIGYGIYIYANPQEEKKDPPKIVDSQKQEDKNPEAVDDTVAEFFRSNVRNVFTAVEIRNIETGEVYGTIETLPMMGNAMTGKWEVDVDQKRFILTNVSNGNLCAALVTSEDRFTPFKVTKGCPTN